MSEEEKQSGQQQVQSCDSESDSEASVSEKLQEKVSSEPDHEVAEKFQERVSSETEHEVDRLLKFMESPDTLDPSKLPPEMKSLNVQKIKEAYDKAEPISILLTGKTGSGKSTLTNGILGLKVSDKTSAQEGRGMQACTQKVKEYHEIKGKIAVTVWDSPGLQDGTEYQQEYLRQMKEKCVNRDLTFYCIRLSDIRFVSGDENPDVVAMKKLSETFGTDDFWVNTVIVLTFANTLEAFNVDWEDLSEEKKAKAFHAIIQEWEKGIKKVLIEDIKVPKKIVKGIPIVPAGHQRKPHLPGYELWLSALWSECLFTLTTPEKQATLVRLNAERFKTKKEVTKEDFKKPAELQSIVLLPPQKKSRSCAIL